MPLEEFIGKREHSLPLGHAEATFKRPFRAGQLVTVRLAVGRIGDRSFRIEYDLFGQGGEHLATAATVHVCIESASGRSSEIPPQLRALLEKYSTPA
jgi:acyl-CoA thioesterase FadM